MGKLRHGSHTRLRSQGPWHPVSHLGTQWVGGEPELWEVSKRLKGHRAKLQHPASGQGAGPDNPRANGGGGGACKALLDGAGSVTEHGDMGEAGKAPRCPPLGALPPPSLPGVKSTMPRSPWG